MHRCFCRLHGVMLVVNWGSGTSEIVNFVYFNVERERDVVTQKFESRICVQMLDIAFGTGEQIVDAHDFMSQREKSIDEMRAEKAGASGNQGAFAGIV